MVILRIRLIGTPNATERKFRSRPSSSTTKRRRQKQPENKLLSYSLSVMGERPTAAAVSIDVADPMGGEGDWTLYRPQDPGNSPIYIAASPG